ncbi:PREDICTED: Golgi SNAP receptor complex member 1-1-like [Brassica oleracea var. oleracea]|uniref:Golgi SNAP receptor complex member 1-1-like n=1 Tax=Brassica oleracea var. oleracea TaxID=109376 RepID=UPI0006A73ACC|nr:PREDICTED: Golgi SNAP receptor complex member 1-1-like [Brassica oleracea var. oleracea]
MHSYRRLFSTKSDGAESDLEAGIDLLLRQLQQVNAQMQAWICSGGSEMVSHTLTRHQEILQDLTQEFDRHRSSLRTKQEHALLLEDFKEFDRARLDLESGDGSTKQALLNEHVGINRNTAQFCKESQFLFIGGKFIIWEHFLDAMVTSMS